MKIGGRANKFQTIETQHTKFTRWNWKISEVKVIWRWKKIPYGLKDILTEINGRQLIRHRQYTREKKWKTNSIAF